MPINAYNPTTPARRGMTSQDLSDVTTRKPLKSLVKSKKQNAGRNNTGRITVRHRGGGVRRHYRLLNHRLAAGLTLTVEEIEYDPNRSARIARVKDQYGLYHYIIADTGAIKGKVIQTGAEAPVEQGNRLPLAQLPVGAQIYAIEINPGKGAQMVRAAGAKAQLMAKEGGMTQIKLPSGEIRVVPENCLASIGVVSNTEHSNIKIGKAGRTRHMGFRPTVRGKAMNPVDHPHGGGEGGTSIGLKHPKTPWGVAALGLKTRNRKKQSNGLIIRSRKKGRR